MNQTLQTYFDQLEAGRLRMQESLKSAPEECLHSSDDQDVWSPIQIAWHLILAEGGTNRYILKKLKGGQDIPRSGLGSTLRSWLLKTALFLPLRYKAPRGINQPPNDKSLDETVEAWDQIRKNLAQILDGIPDELLDRDLFKHPLAGRMNIFQALDFMVAHLERHEKQLLKRLPADPLGA